MHLYDMCGWLVLVVIVTFLIKLVLYDDRAGVSPKVILEIRKELYGFALSGLLIYRNTLYVRNYKVVRLLDLEIIEIRMELLDCAPSSRPNY